MLFVDIIRKKRDGGELSARAIEIFVNGLADGSLPTEQASALAMAIFLNSMTSEEAVRLTLGMANSGTVLSWEDAGLDGPVVDKHSTGGVGDKVSFLLAPIATACGCYVPMISGRGLGHGGGTLDKIESIPGYNPTPDFALFRKVVRQVGCAIIGQTSELAPADRRLYAIRDVTATVESVPLITASILSKKIAAGLEGLVMDIKVGNGAFMKTMAQAQALAHSIIRTAAAAGLKTHALITDMNEVLGLAAGNAVEIAESVRYLRNEQRESRLDRVVLHLCAEMLVLGGIETELARAKSKADAAVSSGKAAEVFDRMVAALGGPTDFVDNYQKYLPVATVTKPVYAERSGFVSAVDTFAVGNAVLSLGGGRRKIDDVLDLSVGFTDIVPVGSAVEPNRPLATVHAATPEDAAIAARALQQACKVLATTPAEIPVIYDRLTVD